MPIPTPTTDLAVDDIDLGAAEIWARPDRDGIFAKLRAERPVSFHEEPEFPGFPKGPGFWALVRYDDVVRASRDSEIFISGQGSNIGDLPVELLEFFGSMINMDAPRHTKLRLLVNRGFTPRMVARVEETVREQARTIVDAVAPKGECDFVERDRRGAAAPDHLRHDGHPAEPTTGASSSSPTSSSASATPSTRTTHRRPDGRRRWSCPSTRRRSARSASRSPRDDITSARSCRPRSTASA